VVTAQGPRYDPGLVAYLASRAHFVATIHVTRWLVNHEYDARATVTRVLAAVATHGQWLGSCVLANTVIADEYIVDLDGQDWHGKLYGDEAQSKVSVWSCWWQGAAH
jgi:hypothetical protein